MRFLRKYSPKIALTMICSGDTDSCKIGMDKSTAKSSSAQPKTATVCAGSAPMDPIGYDTFCSYGATVCAGSAPMDEK